MNIYICVYLYIYIYNIHIYVYPRLQVNHVTAQTRATKRAAEMGFLNVPKIGDFYGSLLEKWKVVWLSTLATVCPSVAIHTSSLRPIVASHTSRPTSVAGHAFSQCG